MPGFFAFLGQDQEKAKRQWLDREPDAANEADISKVLNFFEQVASECNLGFLDRKAARQTLLYVLVVAWPQAEWLVRWLRAETKESRLLEQWEDAYKTALPLYRAAT